MYEGPEITAVALEIKEGLAVEVGKETEVKQGDPVVQIGEGAKSSWVWHPRAMVKLHHGLDIRAGVPGLRCSTRFKRLSEFRPPFMCS